MSMEARVFFEGAPPSPAAVDAALRELGFDLAVADHGPALDAYGGFVPMRLRTGDDAEDTGTEVYAGNAQETIADLGITGIDPALDRELSVRWGGDALEGACAYALLAALARVTGGTIFDDEEGAVKTVEEAVTIARSLMEMAGDGG